MTETENAAKTPQPAVGVIGQYIKDLSVESPLGMVSLMQMKEKPQFNVGVDVRAHKVNEEVYEVIVMLKCQIPSPDDANKFLFLVDIAYSGIFRIQNVEEAQLQPMLFIYCPNILFPFARRIIADATRDGGAPPLILDPIDFAGLYTQRVQQAQQAQEKAESA